MNVIFKSSLQNYSQYVILRPKAAESRLTSQILRPLRGLRMTREGTYERGMHPREVYR